MSREIDLTKTLSSDDRDWLLARGRTAEVAVSDGITIQELEAAEAADNPGDAVFTPASPADAAARASSTEASVGAYNGWLKEDLVAEAEARGLDSEGLKADLVDRLEADDAGSGDA